MTVRDDIRRLEKSWSLTDRLTGFGDRFKLIADLTDALEPGTAPSVIAVFDLPGWQDYRQLVGEEASDEVIARLAEAFALVVLPVGACYRPREDEFCAIVHSRIGDAYPVLEAAEEALTETTESLRITSSFGAVLLPDEGTEPVEVLMLADERLAAVTSRRTRRDRRRPNAR